MESKKAQNLSITTIILIILGVVVLVVLIIGFTQGWGSVKEFFGGGSKTPQISALCNTACLTEDTDSWCKQEREGGTCDELAYQGKFVDCVGIICPTKKCEDQIVDGGGVYICDTALHEICPEDDEGKTQYVKGDFVDIVGGKVCCKVACEEAPSPQEF